jgi:lipopolysaccharide transport system permease protein
MTATLTADRRATRALEVTQDISFGARQALAVRDLRDAVALWRLCWTLSWLDIKLRYRGSTLGPLWLTLSTAVMVGALGLLNSALFGVPLRDYLPFLALSLVLWGFLSGLIGDACLCFTSVEGMIRSVRMPFSLYAGQIVLRNLLILAHNILVIIVVDVLLQSWPGVEGLLAIPPFLLWLVDGLAFSVLLGAFCARFRDIPPIVASIMQMAFFMSGIIWKPSQLGASEWVMPFNPFFSLLEIVRGPLMGTIPSATIYLSAIGYSVAICVVAWLLFARVRGRIAFWV